MAEDKMGNSLVSSEKAEGKPQKDIQQFEDVVPVKKKELTGWLKWMSDMFFSGRSWKDILKDVVEHQVVPELKDGARNMLVSIIDMKFYKDSSPGGEKTTTNGGFITRYLDYSKASTSKNDETKKALEANKERDETIRKSGYEIPTFTDRKSAEAFLASLKAEAERYDKISVYDLAWKQGKTIDYTWDAYGWPKEVIFAISGPTRLTPPVAVNGVKRYYAIELPKAKPLED